MDKQTQKCEYIAIELFASRLIHIGGYNVPENEVIEVLRDHYEPEYIVSIRNSILGGTLIGIAENPNAKSRSTMHTKQTGPLGAKSSPQDAPAFAGHACILF